MNSPQVPEQSPVGQSAEDALDARALQAVIAGSRSDFDHMYRRYYPRLMDFLVRVVTQRDLAEEIVNDTMYTVWTSGSAFAGRSKVSTWIFGIAYRKALKRLLRNRHTGLESLDDTHELVADENPVHDADIARLRGALNTALARLSPAHRSVVELTYLLDYSYEEIADIVGCPVNTVKTRMFHARAHLRRLLGALASARG
ncbi:MAG: polymerase sigma-E factor protein [Pseudomonadota bacterium]|jgi:RNA polymerase sigma-70 factor (ECF subfamily)